MTEGDLFLLVFAMVMLLTGGIAIGCFLVTKIRYRVMTPEEQKAEEERKEMRRWENNIQC
jgi:hypothetical protein